MFNNNRNNFSNRGYNRNNGYSRQRNNRSRRFPAESVGYPDYIVNLVKFIKRNQDISRYTALAVINILKNRGDIPKNYITYVEFKFSCYTVTAKSAEQDFKNRDYVKRDYYYDNRDFYIAICSALTNIANNAVVTLNDFYKHSNVSPENSKEESEEIKKVATEVFSSIDNLVEEEDKTQNGE